MKPRFKPYLLCAALAMALLGALAGLNATASHGGAEAKPADKAEAPAGEGGEKGEGEKTAAAPVTSRPIPMRAAAAHLLRRPDFWRGFFDDMEGISSALT